LYPLRPDDTIAVTEVDGSLFIQSTQGRNLLIYASVKNQFFIKAFPAQISFLRAESGLSKKTRPRYRCGPGRIHRT